MVTLSKDRKGLSWIITREDSEGFHRQLSLLPEEMDELVRLWQQQSRLTSR